MGLGVLGRGVGDARFLAEQGAKVVVTDLKTKKDLKDSVKELENFKNISLVLGGHRMKDFKETDLVIKGAGVPISSPYIDQARLEGIPIRMSSALFAEMTPATVIGVTGTKGKTTTSYLLHHIFNKAGKEVFLGGNARLISTLSYLPKSKKGELAILELDSWQLQGFGEVKMSPSFSVFTNFSSDHMDYYKGDMEAYFKDKSYIFLYQKRGDVLVLGEQVYKKMKGSYMESIKGELVIPTINNIPRKLSSLIPGEHNLHNISLAVSLAERFGISSKESFDHLVDFKGVPGRLEYRGSFNDRKFYNDNNATTPSATVSAIEALKNKGRIILIVGGHDKGLSLTDIKNKINSSVFMSFVLPGSGSDKLLDKLDLSKVKKVSGVVESVKLAYESSKEGDIILFSPGFSSFSQFKNAYQREKVFLEEIDKRFGL